MKRPSIFLFSIPRDDHIRGAVLFPVLAKGSKVIFATCAHTIREISGTYGMIICDIDGRPLPSRPETMNSMILPPETGLDLAFVEMHMEEVPPLVKWSDRLISRGTVLNYARNVMNRADHPDQTCVISEQTVSPINRRFSFVGNRYLEASVQTRVLGQAMKNPVRALAMRSWPGASGSPL